ncbi:MAG: hypothetical protein HY898_29430 [Deltaproteobacteria bacterium]|nr:hypothetical protein [Deltaproteobacteria bacterium]
MNGPTHPGQPGDEPDPDFDDEETANQDGAAVLDWLDRIIPVAIGSGSALGKGAEAERPSQFGEGAAEMASLHAKAEAARSLGDEPVEREALMQLARVFASRGYHLASAVHAARRALQLAEDADLRAELSLWLESLGEPVTAASTLRALVETASTARDAARLLARIGRLLIRAGDYQAALEALLDASNVWVGFAEPLELAAVLAAAMQRKDAVELMLEAADRHDALNAKEKAFEARRRAFEIAPGDGRAARALVRVLDQTNRAPAADEILRLHAEAIEPEPARELHAERMQRALDLGDAGVALQALVDGDFEGVTEGPVASVVDDVLDRIGLHDAVALRLDFKAAGCEGAQRAQVLLQQARLFMGRLASPDRALEAWIEAFACDPQNQDALQALRTHATTMRDPMPLVEALIRAVPTAPTQEIRLECLRELEAIAEERLADPSLGLWALRQRAEAGGDREAIDQAIERLLPRVRLQDGALQSARESLAGDSGEAGTEALRRIAAILRGRPQSIEEYLQVLCQLVSQSDEERRWWIELERAALRAGREDLLEERLRARLERGAARVDLARMRTLLATLAVRRGDIVLALAEARSLIQEIPGHRPAAVMTWVLAGRAGDPAAKAEAIELIAPTLTARMRAALQSIAADLWFALGQSEDAQRLGELAARSDAAEPRVLAQQARLALTGVNVEVRVLEKACSVLMPGARMLEATALAFERAGDRRLAFSWTRRLFELCPWDHRLLDLLVVRGATSGKAEQLAEVVVEAIGSCFSITMLAPILDKGLRALAAFDPAVASDAAYKVLSAVGPRYEPIRTLIQDIAAASRNPRLAIAVIERWLAGGASASEHPALLLQLARHYHEVADADGEALAIVRGAVIGEPREALLAALEGSLAPTSADGVLARSHARALLVDPQDDARSADAAKAWRLLGAALWDLAGDRGSAVAAWVRAAELDEAGGPEKLACDLESFAGEDEAHVVLSDHALGLDEPAAAARLLVVASAIALRNHHPASALEIGTKALELDPSRTDALAIIERASDACRKVEAIDSAYSLAAQSARGCVGRRAAHHRAARELDRRGRADLAIAHAIAAFDADPINGAVLRLMLRLAENTDPSEVLQTLRRAADAATDPEGRALWLREGAALAARSPAHQRTALEMALSALNASPDADVARLLGEVMVATLSASPEERDILEMRLLRALKAVESKLEGPRGARVAILMARMAIDALSSATLAMGWLLAAIACSGDVDEYEALVDVAGSLCTDREPATRFLDEVIKRAETRSGPVGPALLTFASTLAYALDDGVRGDALVEVAQQAAAEDQQADPFADFGESDRPPPEPEAGAPAEAEALAPPEPEAAAPQEPEVVAPPESEAAAPQEPEAAAPPEPEAVAPPEPEPVAPPEPETVVAPVAQAAAGSPPPPPPPVPSAPLPLAPPAIQPIGPSPEPSFLAEALLTAADQIAAEESAQLAARSEEPDAEITLGAEDQLEITEELAEPAAEPSPPAPSAEPAPPPPVPAQAPAPPPPAPEPQNDDPLRRAWALQSRGEIQAAIELLELAAKQDASLAPEYDVRLRELYGLSGRNTQLRLVLDRIAERSADPHLRETLLAEAATLCEARGDNDGARARWMQVFDQDPWHGDAWAFLERDAVERDDHERLATLLTARVAAAKDDEDYRAAVARRAIVLEEHLGRTEQAIAELEEALAKRGDEEGLLRLLAELIEHKSGAPASARCWSRLARVTDDRATAVAMACKAANFFLAEGLDAQAREAIAALGEVRTAPALEILVAIERRSGDMKALGQALEALTAHSVEDASRRARWLIQAADASMLYGNGQEAVERAMRAAQMVPEDSSVQLYAILLQYKVEGLGNLTQVRAMGARLDSVADRIGTEDVPMHAFLSAEVAGVLHGGDAALEVLARRHGEVGLKPLIALGMAERLAAAGSVEHALPLFDVAIGAKDLQLVRTTAQVAFAAGRAALRARDLERARAFLAIIEAQPDATEMVVRLRADIERAAAEAVRPPAAPIQPSPVVTLRPAPMEQPSVPTAPPPAPPSPVPAASAEPAQKVPSAPPLPAEFQTHPTPALGSARVDSDAPPPSMAYVPVTSSKTEQDLFAELAQGSVEAGDELAAILERDPTRTHDLAAVRRRQVVIAPTELRLLLALRDAAQADRNRAHADAVEHVIASVSGRVPPSPPAMLQHEAPDRVLAMLLRGVHTSVSEAFGHLWTHAPHVLSREAIPYDLESMDHVAFGSPSPVGKAYSTAVRVLGLGKVSVHCHRSRGPLQAAVALTSPPSVVITGAIEDSTELRFKLAFILAATLPANVMLFCMHEKKIRTLLQAMVAAFGPPEASRGTESGTVQLAGHLWHALPVRVQRRMTEIFSQPGGFTYEDIWARALQSARRGGLFVVGDVGTAIRDTLGDPGVAESVDLKSPGYLVQICKASASATDLLRLATSAEYAEARWRTEGVERRGAWASGSRQEGA